MPILERVGVGGKMFPESNDDQQTCVGKSKNFQVLKGGQLLNACLAWRSWVLVTESQEVCGWKVRLEP